MVEVEAGHATVGRYKLRKMVAESSENHQLRPDKYYGTEEGIQNISRFLPTKAKSSEMKTLAT